MNKHTPGPWFYFTVQRTRNTTVSTVKRGKYSTQVPLEADARLIVEAPQLLIKARQFACVLRQINNSNALPGNDYNELEKDVLELIDRIERRGK